MESTAIEPTPIERFLRDKFWLAGLLTALCALAVYWGATSFGLFTVDEPAWLATGTLVEKGSALEGLKAALQWTATGYWSGLTGLSHLLDHNLFGPDPAAVHRTNVLLFAIEGFLVALTLLKLTGDPVKSLLAALLFTVHPARIEAVALLGGRKELLAGIAFFGAVYCYAAYAKERTIKNYLLLLAVAVCSLTANPSFIMLAPLLLLLDYWPLVRYGEEGLTLATLPKSRLALEKLPLLVLGGFALYLGGLLTASQNSSQSAPMVQRLIDLPVLLVSYLAAFFVPTAMVVPVEYHPASSPLTSLGALALLGGSTLGFYYLRKSCPALLVGWLGWLLLQLPHAGLLRTSGPLLAREYTGIAHSTLSVALVWGVCAASEKWGRVARTGLIALGVAVALTMAITYNQLPNWANQNTLTAHALVNAPDDPAANGVAGLEHFRNSEYPEAAAALDRALAKWGGWEEGKMMRALVHANMQEFSEARELLNAIVLEDPLHPDVHYQLALVNIVENRAEEALTELKTELENHPRHFDAAFNAANLYHRMGNLTQAEEFYLKAIDLWPEDPLTRYNLGILYAQTQKLGFAREQMAEAAKLDPRNPEVALWRSALESMAPGTRDFSGLPGPAPFLTRRDDLI